jgi:HK97 family phage prohead protease
MEKNKEYRIFKAPVELRADGDSAGVIEGIAAVVNQETDLGWFREIIMPGAFDDVLGDDVRALFNHDSNKVLARTTAGTLDLYLDDKGNLAYRYTTPDRTYAKDLEDMIRTGDVNQSSFAFVIAESEWVYDENEELELRRITRIGKLYDVSPVTYPAYADTTVAKRCYDNECKLRNAKNDNKQKRNADYVKRQMEIIKLGRADS